MAETKTCPSCGAKLAADAPDAPCPACLMKLGMRSWENRRSVEPTVGSSPAGDFKPPEPAELAGQFPQFDVLELIGFGGMGAVYKARQKSLDRIVALKIIKPDNTEGNGFSDRFAREARALAKLNHPNIVSVHDFGESEGLFYLVMEFVDGANLRQLIATQTLAPEKAIEIIPQVCEALQFAHDEGIVHRDIKPENILIDIRGRVKIADFGLAKLRTDGDRTETLTRTHQVMGTPRYMAPEQMEGSHSVDHRADIYSLGVVFYEMLTGELPLGRFDLPSQKATIGKQWDDVVLRALQKEPQRRYQHASEVKLDVERLSDADGPPVRMAELASPASPASPTPAASPVPPASPIPPSAAAEGESNPNFGMLILGSVMAGLGMLLLVASGLTGNFPLIWVGIGIALGGAGCFSTAFAEDNRIPNGVQPDVGMLVQGAVMGLIGLALFGFAFAQGLMIGSPFLWVGIGLTIGGGGCCQAAWNVKKRRGQRAAARANARAGAPAKPPTLAEAPRFTPLVGLAWILGAIGIMVATGVSPLSQMPAVMLALSLTTSITTGLVLAGGAVCLGQWWRGVKYPIHPGEWMWLVNATAALCWLVLQLLVLIPRQLEEAGIIEFGRVLPTSSLVVLLVAGLLHAGLAIVLVFVVRPARWRIYLAAFAVGLIGRAAVHGVGLASFWSPVANISGIRIAGLTIAVLPVIPLVIALAADILERKRYPWSHWVGVLLQACFHAVLLAYLVIQILSTL